ncbi:hypothetical protein XA3_04170 [Xylocopilactobacillus apicola]|uniref:SnoaL-like domain-containing protein n=2 Tax=Xylocopilactobacillus apicola TaxID=2932184 RepID=A0AAU9DI23_9LACO|nr:hypothetical protein XA3_04170 [Xylocopilactobacillus apicola]
MEADELIRAYFSAWEQHKFAPAEKYFTADIKYRECYGPVYEGLEEVQLWMNKMKERQVVLAWKIKRILPVNDSIRVVEWYFHAREDSEYDFDGVSIIEFEHGKMKKVSEYEAKHQTYRPLKPLTD